MAFRLRIFPLAVLAMSAMLAGCSLFRPDHALPPCPRISVLSDASTLTRFRSGGDQSPGNTILHAEIQSYKGSCVYDDKKKVMTVSLRVGMGVDLGLAAATRNDQIAYFVTMPGYFPTASAKTVFPVRLAFPAGNNHLDVTDDEITVTFPLREVKNLDPYQIFVGFQLDAAQLEYNRNLRRSTIAPGSPSLLK